MQEQYPFFSVIVPTYQRPDHLAACLEGLAALRYPNDRFEVIVVDDGSQASPEPVITPLQHRITVTLVHQTHAGPSVARNAGAARANGEFLVFIDDDCVPAPDWLERLTEHFAAYPETALGGRTINACPANWFSTAGQLLLDYLYEYHRVHDSYDRFFASNNLAFPARMFYGIGGFDETFTRPGAEDRELCFRWLFYGYSMIYASDVVVYHSHWLAPGSFWRQHFRYGRGAFHYHRLRHLRLPGKRRLKGPPFYIQLVLYPLSIEAPASRTPMLMAILTVSQFANASGYFWEVWRNNCSRVRSAVRRHWEVRIRSHRGINSHQDRRAVEDIRAQPLAVLAADQALQGAAKFLRSRAAVLHTDTSLLSHLVATASLLQRWDCPDHLRLAGLFHTVYGTEHFKEAIACMTERVAIGDLIGPAAEELVHLYCTMTRESLYAAVGRTKSAAELISRDGRPLPVTQPALRELLILDVASTVAVLPYLSRSAVVTERALDAYARLAPFLSIPCLKDLFTARLARCGTAHEIRMAACTDERTAQPALACKWRDSPDTLQP